MDVSELGLITSRRVDNSAVLLITEHDANLPDDVGQIQRLVRPEPDKIGTEPFLAEIDRWFQQLAERLPPNPIEEARRLLQKREYRAAVIASSVALEEEFRKLLPAPTLQQQRLGTLRDFISAASRYGVLTEAQIQESKKVTELRNRLVHTGQGISEKEARSAVATVFEPAYTAAAKTIAGWKSPQLATDGFPSGHRPSVHSRARRHSDVIHTRQNWQYSPNTAPAHPERRSGEWRQEESLWRINLRRMVGRYTSDELTHFVGRAVANLEDRYDLFRKIVREGWLQPSNSNYGVGFSGHSDGPKPLSSNEAVKTPFVSFCDIPVATLRVHMVKYGPFGIALAKKLLVGMGATPLPYVELNARHIDVGIGPRTVGEWFDELRRKMQQFEFDLGSYVEGHEGRPKFLMSLSPPGTPPGHRLLGQLAGIRNELEYRVLGQLKFFDSRLPEDHPENYYMEREWRVPAGVRFYVRDIERVIMPGRFVTRFCKEVPSYAGEIIDADDLSVAACKK